MSGQHHSPWQRSFGSRQRGAEQSSPQRAGSGFQQPGGRAAERPPTEASAAEPSSPVPQQTQCRTFSSSHRGSSCFAHAGVIESEQRCEMSTGRMTSRTVGVAFLVPVRNHRTFNGFNWNMTITYFEAIVIERWKFIQFYFKSWKCSQLFLVDLTQQRQSTGVLGLNCTSRFWLAEPETVQSHVTVTKTRDDCAFCFVLYDTFILHRFLTVGKEK